MNKHDFLGILGTIANMADTKSEYFISSEMNQLGNEVQGDCLTPDQIGERMRGIILEALEDEYDEGKKQGLKLMITLYKNMLKPFLGTDQQGMAVENFERYMNGYAFINQVQLDKE